MLPKNDAGAQLTSLLPLPKPLITGPRSLIGNGGSGPDSGPAYGSRGPSGRISRSRSCVKFRLCKRGVVTLRGGVVVVVVVVVEVVGRFYIGLGKQAD